MQMLMLEVMGIPAAPKESSKSHAVIDLMQSTGMDYANYITEVIFSMNTKPLI